MEAEVVRIGAGGKLDLKFELPQALSGLGTAVAKIPMTGDELSEFRENLMFALETYRKFISEQEPWSRTLFIPPCYPLLCGRCKTAKRETAGEETTE